MVLYELQLDGGAATVSEKSAWSTLRWEFVRDAYKRVGMKDQALRALSQILVRCSEYRYDVLEVFSVGEVFLASLGRKVFVWPVVSVGKSQYETTSPEANSKIQCEVYLFCRPDRSAAIAESLRAAAQAAGGRDAPPPVLTDPAFREAVLAQSGEEQVLDATVAVLGPAPRRGLFAAEAKAHTTPRLFVLTVSSVLELWWEMDEEFAINSSAWAPVSKLDPAMFEDFTPADLEEAEQEQEEDVLPPPSEAPPGTEWICKGPSFFGVMRIHFETRNEADLTLHFSGGAVCIRFFTDSSRELWRRGLAYVLTKSEKGWERQY
eukprot:g1809.t1